MSRSSLLIPFLICLVLPEQIFAQQQERIDTIYVSASKTTTLMFPNEILLFDIGSEEFGGVKSNTLLLLKSVDVKANPTSILVQYGKDDIYHGTLAYKETPPKTFIDFRKVLVPKVPNEMRSSQKDSTKTLDTDISEKRLNVLISDTKINYRTLAIRNDKMSLSLTDMMIDEESLYLKLIFMNENKLDYKIDFVEFIYAEPSESKELKGGYERKNVYPKASNKIEGVRGKDKRYLGFCIPRYALSRNGFLTIVMREKEGSRMMELTVPFKEILLASHVSKR